MFHCNAQCFAKLVSKNCGDLILCNLLHRDSCRSYKTMMDVTSRHRLIKSVALCRILNALNSNNYLSLNAYSVNTSENFRRDTSQRSDYIPQDVLHKIKYNCILSEKTMSMNWAQKVRHKQLEMKKERERRQNDPDISFSLKYLNTNISTETKPCEENESVFLPFQNVTYKPNRVAFKRDESFKFYSDRSIETQSEFSEGVLKTKDWLKNYEFYKDSKEVEGVAPWLLNYGTPDRSVPVSKVPCGGCGANLQCQDTGIPGYLPSEIVKMCTIAELRALKCQRCHFLEKYNMALNLNVSADDYPQLLAHIENEYALVILIVDLTDFPCSLWPGIIKIIGTKRPVIVVGNKIDLLPRDSQEFSTYAQLWLENAVNNSELADANIKKVVLVSARTGYGVEKLITNLHNIWGSKGDVYLLGCTNVGKSTLFNALLQSDYCKVQAVDIMQRATTSPWPGTTLSLLKFPIFRVNGWRLLQRVKRLQALEKKQREEIMLLREQLKKNRNPHQATLIGRVGQTFVDGSFASDALDPFSISPSSDSHSQLPGLDPSNKIFAQGRWCYDTPGTVHPDQIIDILTAQELVNLLPREMILPRTFKLSPGNSVLIAGLGRLDFEDGVEDVRFTVFAASTLPITICCTSDVDEVYEALATSNHLVVPNSKVERLAQWPGLTAHSHSFEITGIHDKESAADIVLSSAGWIAVTPEQGQTCVVKAWTPFARGIHFRQPALLRFSVALRGKKVSKSPAYLVGRAVKV